MAAASEISKSAPQPDEPEVTSQHRGRGGGGLAEETGQLGRQPSLYSLTLDELHDAVCGPGRDFGSMNMDEFLANIWNAEELQATAGGNAAAVEETVVAGAGGGGGLHRQGSYSVPAPLCRKTVEEVWAEISLEQAQAQQQMENRSGVGGNGRQPTMGEMTLEDFLVKAGVVREAQGGAPPLATAALVAPLQQEQFGVAFSADANGVYSVMGDGIPYANGGGAVGNGYGGMSVAPPPPQAGAAPMSPGSSDRMAPSQMDGMGCLDNLALVANNGRKRPAGGEADGAEKAVERRQRRMIKNRESAARSRARKQAYTVELEAELNQLKEENARLRAEEKRILLTRKQRLVEMMMERSKENARGRKAGRTHRRCGSCLW